MSSKVSSLVLQLAILGRLEKLKKLEKSGRKGEQDGVCSEEAKVGGGICFTVGDFAKVTGYFDLYSLEYNAHVMVDCYINVSPSRHGISYEFIRQLIMNAEKLELIRRLSEDERSNAEKLGLIESVQGVEGFEEGGAWTFVENDDDKALTNSSSEAGKGGGSGDGSGRGNGNGNGKGGGSNGGNGRNDGRGGGIGEVLSHPILFSYDHESFVDLVDNLFSDGVL